MKGAGLRMWAAGMLVTGCMDLRLHQVSGADSQRLDRWMAPRNPILPPAEP